MPVIFYRGKRLVLCQNFFLLIFTVQSPPIPNCHSANSVTRQLHDIISPSDLSCLARLFLYPETTLYMKHVTVCCLELTGAFLSLCAYTNVFKLLLWAKLFHFLLWLSFILHLSLHLHSLPHRELGTNVYSALPVNLLVD